MYKQRTIMNCKQTQHQFLFFIEGSLSIQKTQEIHDHLQKCEACSLLFNSIKDTYNAFDNMPLPDMNPYLAYKIESHLTKHSIHLNIAHLPFSRILPKIAASVIIIIGLVLGIFVGGQMKYLHAANQESNLNKAVEMYTGVYNSTGENSEALFSNE
jgi:hypothetical protein